MATIVDVARLAGVSTSTVSHVVNETRVVADATRERVLAAVAQVNYRQDGVARAMRRSKTDSIGVVVSDASQPMFAEMVHGVEQGATPAGLTVLLANSTEDPRQEAKILDVLEARRVDGIVVAPVAHSLASHLDAIRDRGIPIVLMDRLGLLDIDQVGVVNTDPTAELVRHLAGHGHRRIGLVVGDLAVATMSERRLGYDQGLRAAGLSPDEDLVVVSTGSAEQTCTSVKELLSSPARPTALVAASTTTAAGALLAAQELNLRCPQDLAFATFDGFAYPDLFHPRITTVTQPTREVGTAAFRLLQARMNGHRSDPFEVIRLEPAIDYRDSCGCHS